MSFNYLLNLVATLAPGLTGAITWEDAWEPSGVRFRHCNQDTGFPCAFQALRPISAHTYPCRGGAGGKSFHAIPEVDPNMCAVPGFRPPGFIR